MPPSSLRIEVQPPRKSEHRYEFRCDVWGQALNRKVLTYRAKALAKGFGALLHTRLRFGYVAENFRIRHSELWDSVYPLMYLTRNGGPILNAGYTRATIRFHYPLTAAVAEFYRRRAANFGLDIRIEADTLDATYDIPTSNHLVSFGGGKDSRLLIGLLRETQSTPCALFADIGHRPGDIPGLMVVRPLHGVQTDRLMPAFMSGFRDIHIGSGLGEAHFNWPWQQYYDYGSREGQEEFSLLLAGLGCDLRLHAHASVLPYNLIQRILADRYPHLHAHQVSVTPGERNEKNLHVALMELYHGLEFRSHCPHALFRDLLGDFVRRQTRRPDDFGANNYREVINREMRALAWARRDHPLIAPVAEQIPPDWQGEWIDYIHTYVDGRVPEPILEIYRQYAQDYRPRPGDYRVPVPGTPSNQARTGIPAAFATEEWSVGAVKPARRSGP